MLLVAMRSGDTPVPIPKMCIRDRSIMAVMSLGVKKGNEVIITAEGEDEEDAIAEIQKVLEENL